MNLFSLFIIMRDKLDRQNKQDKLIKHYNDIKKRYLSKIGIKMDHRLTKRYDVTRSKPIPIPIPSSDDDL